MNTQPTDPCPKCGRPTRRHYGKSGPRPSRRQLKAWANTHWQLVQAGYPPEPAEPIWSHDLVVCEGRHDKADPCDWFVDVDDRYVL